MVAPLADVVGAKTAKGLAKLDIHTLEDLLRHYPRRYAKRGELTDLASLKVGDSVTVFAEVYSSRSRPLKQRGSSMLEVVVTDGTGRLTLTFFRQSWREKHLVAGRQGLFSGKVSDFRGTRQLSHPEYVLSPLGNDIDPESIAAFASEIIAIYPATAAIPSWRISACIDLALPYAADVLDPLPEVVRSERELPTLVAAMQGIHRPQSDEERYASIARMKFDEAFVLQTELLRRRNDNRALPASPRSVRGGGLLEKFDAALPYELTRGQQQIGDDIFADLIRDFPMQRLLQGEVGSGKTVVALRAMLAVADAGGQSALLAPTEVLASQHYQSIHKLLGSLSGHGIMSSRDDTVTVTLLTGSMSTPARRQALLEIQSGTAGIVIGTHALLQDKVGFADLGLVVVDEQHRFGVEQRARLLEKSSGDFRPHMLVMTATPIPRTVAMTVFADLDVSTLTELPAGRAPITTHVVAAASQPKHVERVWARIREEVAQGRKAYVVCPRIGGVEESATGKSTTGKSATGTGDAANFDDEFNSDDGELVLHGAVELFDELRTGLLSTVRTGLLHGRMHTDDKDATMHRFALPHEDADALDVLVATTVIEVGVDVPTASVMVVMDADRFGVSQLHQLRGRVGRGGLPGLCLLVTFADDAAPSRERLDMVASTTDGFALSAYDLSVRREGNVLGADQSGRGTSLRLLQVLVDQDVVIAARDAAERILTDDPHLTHHPRLFEAVSRLASEAAEFMEKS